MGGPAVLSEGGAQRDHNHDLEQPLILQLRKIRPAGSNGFITVFLTHFFLMFCLSYFLINESVRPKRVPVLGHTYTDVSLGQIYSCIVTIIFQGIFR